MSLSELPWHSLLLSVVLAIPLFVKFGLYRAIFRYAGWNAMVSLVQAMTLYGLFYATVFTAIGVTGVPRTIGLIQPMIGCQDSLSHLGHL